MNLKPRDRVSSKLAHILKTFGSELPQLSQTQISEKGYKKSELYYLRTQEQEYGPYYYQQLNKWALETPGFPRDCDCRQADSEQWQPFYSYAYFDRRSEENRKTYHIDENTEYFLLEEGQKIGPFTIEDIQDKYAKKEVLVTDEVAIDGGQTWLHIFELPAFDRRKHPDPQHDQDHLPYLPDREMLSEHEDDWNEEDDKKAMDDLADLAISGHIQAPISASSEGPAEPYKTESITMSRESKKKIYMGLMATAVAGLIVVIGIGLFSGKKGTQQPEKVVEKAEKPVKKVAKKPTPRPKIERPKRINKTPQLRRPARANNRPSYSRPEPPPPRYQDDHREDEPVYDDLQEEDLFADENRNEDKKKNSKKRVPSSNDEDDYFDDLDEPAEGPEEEEGLFDEVDEY